MTEESGPNAGRAFDASVRDSRAGDQFHYVWAASESLHLLDRRSALQEIWIERSPGVAGSGDEVIDVAECFGPAPDRIERVTVLQLKYSTRRRLQNLGLSELGSTLQKFGALERRSSKAFPLPAGVAPDYVILSNRPFGSRLRRAIEKVAAGETGNVGSDVNRVLGHIGLSRPEAAALCQRLELRQHPWTLPALRAALDGSAVALTGDIDPGTASLLVEAVVLRASGVLAHPIRAADVAAAFRLRVQDLLPAPSLLPTEPAAVQRESWQGLADGIMTCSDPMVVTAVGGMGKSTFAAELPRLLDKRAAVVVYDCFGGGSYRAVDTVRHRHRDGLVQIVSELSGLGLCGPLIPRPSTDGPDYLKLFRDRLVEVVANLPLKSAAKELVVVVDAADNAVIAAEERAERDFVRDLLQMTPVPGVHIVLTARPERVESLRISLNTRVVALAPFSEEESGRLLRSAYPRAQAIEVREFDRRTSGNPRAQSFAIEVTRSLPTCLAMLAGIPMEDSDTLTQLLAVQLDTALNHAGQRRAVLNFLAQLLAVLRPPIPVDVLATLAGCTPDDVVSFVADLRRGLLIDEGGLRFLDEPTETFFRGRYPLEAEAAEHVTAALREQAPRSVYASTVLPQVLWVAGRHRELVDLALSDHALPESGEIERRQVARLRSEFALRAAIALAEPASITQLAMVAGSAAASMERRYTFLRDEPDLAGDLLDSATLDDIRAAGALPSEWPGASLSAEAAMLAMRPERHGEARSRLRAAREAMQAWLDRGRAADDRLENIKARQVAAISFSLYQLDGPKAAERFLALWSPDRWVVECASMLARTLLSRADLAGVEALLAATRSAAVGIAVAGEMQRIAAPLSAVLARHLWSMTEQRRLSVDRDKITAGDEFDTIDRGVAWICATAVRLGIAAPDVAGAKVEQYLPATPPFGLGDRGHTDTGLLLLYALKAQLSDSVLTSEDFVFSNHHSDSMQREARERLSPLLPWATGWATWSTVGLDDESALTLLRSYPSERHDWRNPVVLRRLAGPLAMQFAVSSAAETVVDAGRAILSDAVERVGAYLAADMIASLRGDERFAEVAYRAAEDGASQAENGTWSADEATGALLRLARGLWAFEVAEGRSYAERAVAVASRLGDDAWQRWQALLAVAGAARVDDRDEGARLAARVGRAAELMSPHLNDEIGEQQLVPAVTGLAGPMAFGVVAQWRARRFGSTNWQISLLSEGLQLTAEQPMIAAAMAACADRIALPPVVARLADNGDLTAERRAAIQDLAWARGGEDLPLLRRAEKKSVERESAVREQEGWEGEQVRRRHAVSALLAPLQLDQPGAMTAAADAYMTQPYYSSMLPLLERMVALPVNRQASAVRNFQDATFDRSQVAEFISHAAAHFPGHGAALQKALRDLASDFLSTHGTDLISGWSSGFNATGFGAVLQTSTREVLLLALRAADPSVAVSSSERCYRLAAQAAAMTSPGEAVLALERGLTQLEVEMGAAAWSDALASVPRACTVEEATAGFLWSLLADPAVEMRWRARHAVRLLTIGGEGEVMRALGLIVEHGTPVGYTDPRFPFYEMSAVESFLVALERVALTAPGTLQPLQRAVQVLGQRYPDHWRIQQCCSRIRDRTTTSTQPVDSAVDGEGVTVARPVKILARFQRPDVPKPYSRDAPKVEFKFPMDVDEYWFGELTRCFDTTHAEVMQAASGLVLDEWDWRGSPALLRDPRRVAGVYGEQETWLHKSEFPKIDDLDFYLSYHAMMTVAGRLARTRTWFRDPQDPVPDFEAWQRRFDLARADGFWIADARRPMPAEIGHGRSDASDWQWDVQAVDFERVLLTADGAVTVAMSALDEQHSKYDRVAVRSWLVNAVRGPALLRALQTAPSLNTDGIAHNDELDDPIFQEGDFRIDPWMAVGYSERGEDRRDELAANLQAPPPAPSERAREILGLGSNGLGTEWRVCGYIDVCLRVSTWSQKDRNGRDPRGPSGYRATATAGLLDLLAAKAGCAVLAEVRFSRNDYSSRSYARPTDNDLGPLDDYVRFFLYTANTGWRDYLGDPVARSADRRRA